jgi:hypothetical protein
VHGVGTSFRFSVPQSAMVDERGASTEFHGIAPQLAAST